MCFVQSISLEGCLQWQSEKAGRILSVWPMRSREARQVRNIRNMSHYLELEKKVWFSDLTYKSRDVIRSSKDTKFPGTYREE